jgi:hypothetical protein
MGLPLYGSTTTRPSAPSVQGGRARLQNWSCVVCRLLAQPHSAAAKDINDYQQDNRACQ